MQTNRLDRLPVSRLPVKHRVEIFFFLRAQPAQPDNLDAVRSR